MQIKVNLLFHAVSLMQALEGFDVSKRTEMQNRTSTTSDAYRSHSNLKLSTSIPKIPVVMIRDLLTLFVASMKLATMSACLMIVNRARRINLKLITEASLLNR